jgi:elongation factor Tu
MRSKSGTAPEFGPDVDKPFLMAIEDVFGITGRGTVVTGRVERGLIKVGDKIEIVGLQKTRKTKCAGLEMYQTTAQEARPGDNVGVLLRDVKREEVVAGQVLAKPGSIAGHTEFEADLRFLSTQDGGRQAPVGADYQPQLRFPGFDVTAAITLPLAVWEIQPGDSLNLEIAIPSAIALEEGTRFTVQEGENTIAQGTVTRIIK